MECNRIKEIVDETKQGLSGELRFAIGPSIAPYILPEFISRYMTDFPDVSLHIEEMRPDSMIEGVSSGMVDIGMANTGFKREGVFEIPLYTERFFVYLSDSCLRKLPVFHPDELEHEHLWVMKEVQCLRESAFSFCKGRRGRRHVYEAGNIDTLIRIVDSNGGYTIIPEMHLDMLSAEQRHNVREIDGDHLSLRKVSLYIREDYVRERMLNSVVQVIKKFVPESMIEPSLLHHDVRL